MYTPDSFDSGEKHSSQANRQKANGQIGQRDDDVNIIVNKKKTKPKISPDSSVGSMDSRAQSECGSIRSSDKEIFPGAIQQGHNIVSISHTFPFHGHRLTPLFFYSNSFAATLRVQIVTKAVIQKQTMSR